MCAIIDPRLEKEAGYTMCSKKKPERGLKGAVFGVFLAVLSVFGLAAPAVISAGTAYADPTENAETTESTETTENNENTENTENAENAAGETTTTTSATANLAGDGCQASLGAIGWLVCPTTGKIAEAVDWLYEKIQDILVINPVESKDGAPIYEIWKYCRGLTNVVFIIFLLVVIYSQITGLGISNYGIKKVLPKLIVVAVLVNLSFLVCSIAVDLSNIVGSSLRGVFEQVEAAAVAGMGSETGASAAEIRLANSDMFSAIVGGSALAVGGAVITFETGAIWMLIPTVLGSIVAVATGLITIALRQAVVALLVMISPLAVVAYMLPNTENLFQKWKKLLQQMLVFYPMVSLLFGAANLAGFAIVASATDGFGLLLGTAVQIFPLFFSWKLMQMSGTFLGNINARIQGLATKPLAKNRAWADSHRENTKQRMLSSGRATTPSLRLMQFVSNRRVAREADTSERAELVKARGMAYRASRNYNRNGVPTRRGERAYENQAKMLEYQQAIERDKNNMDKGLGQLTAVAAHASDGKKARLGALDGRIVRAADNLKIEQARGEKISYENAAGYHQRMEAAINTHFDDLNASDKTYRQHEIEDRAAARARYAAANAIMEGNLADIQFAAADAAHGYDTQKKIIETKMGKYFELTPPTKDAEMRLNEMTKLKNAQEQIDMILPGLRALNQRGDTDLVRKQIEQVLNSEDGIQLGSHASQALASFLMFEVKDSDPFLRRFGKYINLETAQVYNKNKRQNARLSLEEYITGEYEDWDADDPTKKIIRKPRRSIVPLLEGTSLDNLERTAYANVDDMIKNAYTKNGVLDIDKYLAKREEIEKSIGPAFTSASLKYPSGSEQLKNAVAFLTGYNEDTPRWRDVEDPLYGSKKAEKHFRQKTVEYLMNQTPTQIFGLRSDYHAALLEHLSKAYEEADTTGWSKEAIDERNEYMRELAEIQTRYGDSPIGEAKEKRDEEIKDLKNKMAGVEFRQVLDSNGMLGQIYRTRRSGAANGAKHWVRGWLNLDNEALVMMKLEADREEQKKKLKEAGLWSDEDNGGDSGVYDAGDRMKFAADIRALQNDLKDESREVFFDESIKYIRSKLGRNSFIEVMYREYYNDDKFADNYTLAEYLAELLKDKDSYSG